MKIKNLVFVFLLFLIACNKNDEIKLEIDKTLTQVKNEFAPDTRLTIHSIEYNLENNKCILTGETAHQNSISRIKSLLTHLEIEIIDSVQKYDLETSNFKNTGIINVSVANLRSSPKESAELASQTLLGSKIKIIKKSRSWFYVQTEDNYLGWMSDDSFIMLDENDFANWENSKKIIVTNIFDFVKSNPTENSSTISDVVSGCKLIIENNSKNWATVIFPDKRKGFLKNNSGVGLLIWQKQTKPKSEKIEQVAKSLLGSPYLWGGTSVKGMDCSGFTKTVFMLNGIPLLRDANQQSLQGKEIKTDTNFQNLKKGDLLFFGNKEKNKITHVGIYLDNGNVIHASGMVKINNLNPIANNFSERLRRTFITARRYF